MQHNQKTGFHSALTKLTALALLAVLICTLTVGALATDVTDGLGRTVTIPAAPQRIVVLPVWAEEMLLDMVGPERIVAVSAWGDDPAVSPTAELAAQVKDRVSSDNPEGILALQPDLVVLDTFSSGFDGALVQTLSDAGLNVLCLQSPTDFNTIIDALTLLGTAVGAQEKALEMVNEVQNTLATIAMGMMRVPPENYMTVMFVEDYFDPNGSQGMLCAYGPGSTFDAISKAAGLINVCDAPNYSAVSKEKLVAEWKPQAIIVPSSSFGEDGKFADDAGAANIAGVLADETLAEVPAVKEGKVFAVTDKFRGSTSHYMAQAALEMAKLFYPIQ